MQLRMAIFAEKPLPHAGEQGRQLLTYRTNEDVCPIMRFLGPLTHSPCSYLPVWPLLGWLMQETANFSSLNFMAAKPVLLLVPLRLLICCCLRPPSSCISRRKTAV